MKTIIISALALVFAINANAQTGLEKSNAQRGGQNTAPRTGTTPKATKQHNTYKNTPTAPTNPRVNQSNPRVTTPQRGNPSQGTPPNKRPAKGGRPR